MLNEEQVTSVEEKVDYRITVYSTYPNDVEILAIVITQDKLDDEVLKKIAKYGKVVKTFPFLNTVKVKGSARTLAKLADEDFVRYIMLDEVLSQ